MSAAHIWPLIAVIGVGLGLMLSATLMYAKGARDSDGDSVLGCLPLIVAVAGVVLVWKGADALTSLMGHPR